MGKAKQRRREQKQREILTMPARPIDNDRIYHVFGVGKVRQFFVSPRPGEGHGTDGMPGAWVALASNETLLAEKLGGEVHRRGTQHWVRPTIAGLVDSVKDAAREAGVRPLRAIVKMEKAVFGPSRMPKPGLGTRGPMAPDPMSWNSILARTLGVSITLGSLRALPNGGWLLSRDGETWEPATRDLCATLDSEVRLGAPETLAHSGALALLAYWEKKT